jgi:hypothetical protein
METESNFKINVKQKEVLLLMMGRILQQAVDQGGLAEPSVIALASAAEKVLSTAGENDLSLTLNEKIAVQGCNMIINAVLEGKDPSELIKEVENEARKKAN